MTFRYGHFNIFFSVFLFVMDFPCHTPSHSTQYNTPFGKERDVSLLGAYSLLVCQDEKENKDEGFHSFWINPVTKKTGPQYYDMKKGRLVRYA